MGFAIGWAIQIRATVVILRDVRGRKVNAWDIVALAFVILLGWLAACYFLMAHSFFKARGRAKDRRAQQAAGV